MMKIPRWELMLAGALIAASAILYLIHYMIFQDTYHIAIYTLGDLAFIPIEVLIVTLVIHRLLDYRDRKQKLEKLNMVIGTFFSALGTYLLTLFSDHDPALDEIRGQLQVRGSWTDAEFARVRELLRGHPMKVEIDGLDLVALRNVIAGRNDVLFRMLENPLLLEHESFTDLLQATFHLDEELLARNCLEECKGADRAHIRVDIERVYGYLVVEWLAYMEYLKNNYPYLFSLAMRRNPFDEEAKVELA